MPTGSQGTQRARMIPPPTELHHSMEELPVHSRLPRLDLGVDWESPWEEFRSSVRDFFHGPRVTVEADAPKILIFVSSGLKAGCPAARLPHPLSGTSSS